MTDKTLKFYPDRIVDVVATNYKVGDSMDTALDIISTHIKETKKQIHFYLNRYKKCKKEHSLVYKIKKHRKDIYNFFLFLILYFI